MDRTKVAVDRLLEWTLILIVGTMTINVLWQVFTRFVLSNPSSYTDELARYLLIWAGVLGAAYGVSKRFHLAIDLLPRALTGPRRIILEMGIEVCILVFAFSVMIVGGSQLVSITRQLGQTSAALQISLSYVYSVIPLSGALIAFYNVAFLRRCLRSLRKGDFKAEPAGPDISPLD